VECFINSLSYIFPKNSDSQTMCRGTILCREGIENVPKKFNPTKVIIKFLLEAEFEALVPTTVLC
jgi:hypothetical protein